MPVVPSLCETWQSCDAADVGALVDAEVRAWLDELCWDVAEAWRVIEPARRSGGLPGLVTRDENGKLTGWTAYLPLDGHLQVMALAAPDASTARVLVEGILESAESRASVSTIVCTRLAAPALPDVLRECGFDVERYRYMLRPLPCAGERHSALRPWQAADAFDASAPSLFARAYADVRGLRAFAPGGTPAEWRKYLSSLIAGSGCGTFLTEASFVAMGDDASRPAGAIVATDLGAGTLHVAQMVVDPAVRSRGIGRRLLRAALASADARFSRVTLLVSESNTRAAGLYESIGFRDLATFVVASRRTPGMETT